MLDKQYRHKSVQNSNQLLEAMGPYFFRSDMFVRSTSSYLCATVVFHRVCCRASLHCNAARASRPPAGHGQARPAAAAKKKNCGTFWAGKLHLPSNLLQFKFAQICSKFVLIISTH
jgi:hypothetical protein